MVIDKIKIINGQLSIILYSVTFLSSLSINLQEALFNIISCCMIYMWFCEFQAFTCKSKKSVIHIICYTVLWLLHQHVLVLKCTAELERRKKEVLAASEKNKGRPISPCGSLLKIGIENFVSMHVGLSQALCNVITIILLPSSIFLPKAETFRILTDSDMYKRNVHYIITNFPADETYRFFDNKLSVRLISFRFGSRKVKNEEVWQRFSHIYWIWKCQHLSSTQTKVIMITSRAVIITETFFYRNKTILKELFRTN